MVETHVGLGLAGVAMVRANFEFYKPSVFKATSGEMFRAFSQNCAVKNQNSHFVKNGKMWSIM